MARAKRTARADARRRHRQVHGIEDPTADAPATGAAAGGAPGTAAGPAPGQRLGLTESFRRSFRPLDIRGDIAALPALLRHRATYIPALLTVGSTGVVVATRGTDIVSAFLYAYFIQTPAIGAVFVAGFLAPRASWLLGVLIGLLSAVCYTIIIQSGVAGAATDGGNAADVIAAAFLLSPLMGSLFAAAAAWYRRFLQLSNPNRGRRRQRPAPRSTGDGRSRAVRTKESSRR